MNLFLAFVSVSGVFVIPCLVGWLCSQVCHRAKVAAFRRGKEQALQQYADYLPESRVKLREDLAWNSGFWEGMKSNGVALRAANGRFTNRTAAAIR